MAARGADSRVQILDVAEALFADRGYFGVSIREITDAADTRLAAVNYHFGSKEQLFGQVITRRAEWLNSERLRRLPTNPEAHERDEAIRDLVRAFYTPMLERFQSGDAGWRNYCRLISQVAMVHLWMDDYIVPIFNEVAMAYAETLRRISPTTEERKVLSAVQFLISSVLYTFADNKRIDSMSDDRVHSDDMPSLAQDVEDFCTAGIRRLLN